MFLKECFEWHQAPRHGLYWYQLENIGQLLVLAGVPLSVALTLATQYQESVTNVEAESLRTFLAFSNTVKQ